MTRITAPVGRGLLWANFALGRVGSYSMPHDINAPKGGTMAIGRAIERSTPAQMGRGGELFVEDGGSARGGAAGGVGVTRVVE